MPRPQQIVLLSGGVGGSKLVEGFALEFGQESLTVIGNTGDDVVQHGLHVSPDLDIVLYTLAGIVDREQGWGLAGDTFTLLDRLAELGEETWFRLGDRDLAMSLLRTNLLRDGRRLTEAMTVLAERLGVRTRVIPPSDDPVRTFIETPSGRLAFQEFFVRDRCTPEILDVTCDGAEHATMTPEAKDAITGATLIVIAPSNPIASIGPILAVPGIREALLAAKAPVVAVSPLVGGRSLKGPSDRMMKAKGFEANARGVAAYYGKLIDLLVIDEEDTEVATTIEKDGMPVRIAKTVMKTIDEKRGLARMLASDAGQMSLTKIDRQSRTEAEVPHSGAEPFRAVDQFSSSMPTSARR